MVYARSDVSRSLRTGAEMSRLLGGKHSGLYNGLVTAQQVFEGFQRTKDIWQSRTRWSVTVRSNDRLYDAAHRWFVEGQVMSTPPRALNARIARARRDIDDVFNSRPAPSPTVELYWDEARERTVVIDGHKVTVEIHQPEFHGGGASEGGYRTAEPDILYFHARSRLGQEAVINMLRGMAVDQERRKPALYIMTQWGDWARRDDLPQRPAESVILAEGQMDRLQNDMRSFLENEGDYVRRGIPYHRGYMLYGPPGTGKTSVVRALAAHFGLDLWYAPLGDLGKDSSLISLVNQVGPRSILLLEDIDIFHATKARDDEGEGLSMAGLLNALDGVATPHGLISVMTTNDINVIDEALLRPGRVDLREHIDLPDAGQIARLFEQWYGVPMREEDLARLDFDGSTAEVSEIFKRNMNDPAGGVAGLLAGAGHVIVDMPKGDVPLKAGGRPRRPRPSSMGTMDL